MKLTRRKFFAGLAVAPLVAVAVAKAVPVLADNTSLILARWTKTEMLPDTALPWWRKIHEGEVLSVGDIDRTLLAYWSNHGQD